MKPTVAVALSGGADSAVAASVLLAAGYQVFGIHYLLNDNAYAQAQRGRAEAIGRRLGIDLRVRDATTLFASLVVQPSRAVYVNGRTPNPCVTCNRLVKFGALLDHALELGAERMATGHYARVACTDGRYELMRAVDRNADQSYFLYSIDPRVLDRVLFPLGSMRRHEACAIADREGLATGKPSQDICFDVRPGREESSGDVVDLNGHIVGHHRGLESVTVGQRRGLGIATGKPLYVVRIDADHNQVVVGNEEDLLCRAATLRDVHWLTDKPPSCHQEVMAKARYRAKETPAHVVTEETVVVIFNNPQRALAPGQSVVFYDGDVVLGGGIVDATQESL